MFLDLEKRNKNVRIVSQVT